MNLREGKERSVVISAGGTGGHVIPAQALAKTLMRKGISIYFAASRLRENRFFSKGEFAFFEIPSHPLRLSSPISLLRFMASLCVGTWKGIRLLRKLRPHAVIGFGSYHTVSMLFSAWITRTPIILHEANAQPGRVIRLFAPVARWVGCYFPEAEKELKTKSRDVRLVDLPLRSEMALEYAITREEACVRYGFDPAYPTVLIIGGSQGAKRMNNVFPEALYKLSQWMRYERQSPMLQVIHISGTQEEMERLKKEYERYADGVRVLVTPFESSMHVAYSAAHIVISRSGASTLAEIEAMGKPALLVPYPHATDDHQRKNGLAFLRQGACGKLMSEAELCQEKALSILQELFLESKDTSDSVVRKASSCRRPFSCEIEASIFNSC